MSQHDQKTDFLPPLPQPKPRALSGLTGHFCVTIVSDRANDNWCACAFPHRPSEQYVNAFDQIERFGFGDGVVWVLVQGDRMNRTFLQRLAEGYVNKRQAWEQIDLEYLSQAGR